MRVVLRSLYAWSCLVLVLVCSFSTIARADPDYYEAFKLADSAVKMGEFDAALHMIQTALSKYPNDYALTLKLGWVEFQGERYVEAERSFREARVLSDGSLDSRIGLGWALIQQDRCDEGIAVLNDVLAEEPDDNAQHGLFVCAERTRVRAELARELARVHGTIWASLAGSLYQEHPWLDRAGAAFLGFKLQPIQRLGIGGAYRFSELSATDVRIPSANQHEIYLEAGYLGEHLDLLGHGALVWGGLEVVGGSRHIGSSLRLKYLNDLVTEVLVEVSGSFYQDLWVLGLAPSTTLTLAPVSLTAGVSAQQFVHETLLSGTLTASLTLGNFSFWAGGKYGPEYRAAYMSQFAVFNAAERSTWAILAGARVRTAEQWSIFLSYALLNLQSPDGLQSKVHNLSVGTAFTL